MPGQHQQVARLFDFMLQGERLASDCAARQVKLFDDGPSRKFLDNQARQERVHAQVFKAGIGLVAPKGVSGTPGTNVLRRYYRLLDEALLQGRRDESLLAMQVLLEGMGEITLQHIDRGIVDRRLGFLFKRLRRIVIGQEDAHHLFGVKRLARETGVSGPSPQLRARSQDYLQLIEELILSTAGLFADFDEDPQQYLDEFYRDLPKWLERPGQ